MSLGTILVILLIIFLLGGFSGRFGGYGYGFGHAGVGVLGIVLIIVVSILTPNFLKPININNILAQTAVIAIVAVNPPLVNYLPNRISLLSETAPLAGGLTGAAWWGSWTWWCSLV